MLVQNEHARSNFLYVSAQSDTKNSKSQHMSVINRVIQRRVANYLFCNNKNLSKQLKLC